MGASVQVCKCELGLQEKQWVCGLGLDSGGAVSRETGICLKTACCLSGVCSGNAANHRGVTDLQGNASQHYTNMSRPCSLSYPSNICWPVQV